MTLGDPYPWQQDLIETAEESTGETIMVVAPSCAGKTRVLKELEERNDATYLTMRGAPSVEVLQDAYDEPDMVLVDEAGMVSDYLGLYNAVSGHEKTTTVVATLPDVPSTAMLKPKFDHTVEVDEKPLP